MKKKVYSLLSLVVSFVLAFGMVSFAADGEAVISVSDASGKPGDVVEIQIIVENNPGIAVAGIHVNYDNSVMKIVEVADGKIWGENMHSPDLTPCPYKLFWFNPIITENISANGVVATLKFEILQDAKAGKYPISLNYDFDNDDILDVNLENVKFSLVNGNVEVIGDEPVTDNIGTTDTPVEIPTDVMTSQKRAKDIICLKIDKSYAYTFGNLTSIDSANDKVVPYIVNDRTLVPLRFVSETLGADVLWEDGWNYCYVNKGDKKIKITFGSADLEVNGEVITYEAPVEVVENRTMVPIRFISEELGYHVHWNQPNKAVVISPAANPWVKDRDAEKSLLTDILVMFLMKGMA